MGCFRFDLGEKLDIIYEGDGESIARRFYIPVLKQTVRYDRISGYFSVDSLVVVAAGLAGFIRNNGRMRLVVGGHDVSPDLKQAYFLSKEKAQELLDEIGKRIAEGLVNLRIMGTGTI